MMRLRNTAGNYGRWAPAIDSENTRNWKQASSDKDTCDEIL
jgi:hypothetical protein